MADKTEVVKDFRFRRPSTAAFSAISESFQADIAAAPGFALMSERLGGGVTADLGRHVLRAIFPFLASRQAKTLSFKTNPHAGHRLESQRVGINAVEIEEAVSELAAAPFDAAEFPFSFLWAFGNKETTVKRLRSASSNSSDIEGGVLQRRPVSSRGTGRASTSVSRLTERVLLGGRK